MDASSNLTGTTVLFLTAIYWLHMLATVVWIGGLVTLSILVFPAMQKTLPPDQKVKFLEIIRKRFQPLSWLSLLVLTGTGLIQMSVHPAYGGFLAIENQWSIAILIKHVLILNLIGFLALMTWGVLPTLERIALKQKMNKAIDENTLSRYQRLEAWIIRGNLVISILVLGFTAWARSVS